MKHLSLVFLSLAVLPVAAQSEEKAQRVPADSVVTLADTISLSGVTVVAQRRLVKQEADRISYDVKNDADAKTQTIMEMLKKVPFVTVDGQNNILVKGSSNFKIYKNGRPNKSFSTNSKDVFASIPASAVKRIEVISEPGAKYDAEGLDGILNIVMDDAAAVDGFVGNGRLKLVSEGAHSASLWGTAQKGKLTVSGNVFGQLQSARSGKNITDAAYSYAQSGHRSYRHRDLSVEGSMGGVSVEASYDIDSLNLLTGSLNMFYYDVDFHGTGNYLLQAQTGEPLLAYDYRYVDKSYSRYMDLDGHVDYQHLTHRKGESINLSYLVATTRSHTHDVTQYNSIVNRLDYALNPARRNNDFAEHTLQLDWTRPLWENHTLDVGAKYILRRNESHSTDEFDNGSKMVSDFTHTTQVAALYAQYKWKIGPVNLMGGWRYEHSFLKASFKDGSNPAFHRRLNDWVPSLTASWRINDFNTLKLNYAMRINRPGISYLNPAVFTSPNSVSQGNPRLESSNQHNLTLSHSLTGAKLTLNTSLYANLSNNQLTSERHVENDVIYSSYVNEGRRRTYGMTIYSQWKVTNTTSWTLNGNAWFARMENRQQGLDNHRIFYYFYTQVSQKLPWKLRIEPYAGRNSGGLNGVYGYSAGTWYYGGSLQRSFLKDDRLTVSLSTWNPISTHNTKYKSYVTKGDYTGKSANQTLNHYFVLNVSMRIGSLNASVKKTKKTVSNDDLQGGRK